jgi:hypothetical protein
MAREKCYVVAPEGVAEFLRSANASLNGPEPPNPVDFKIHTEQGRQDYMQALMAAAQKLRGTDFWIEGDTGATVSYYDNWGRAVYKVLAGLARAKPGDEVPIRIPVIELRSALVKSDGQIKVYADSKDATLYELFLEMLNRLNREHLHVCPICDRLYWGRTDKKVCSMRCRVALCRKNNLEGHKETQARYEVKRAHRDAARKQEKDAEERRRLESLHAPAIPAPRKNA